MKLENETREKGSKVTDTVQIDFGFGVAITSLLLKYDVLMQQHKQITENEMELSHKIVMVEDITSNETLLTEDDTLEKAAESILECGGFTISPIIIKRTGLDSFSVVAGHFEYFAAVRASEIDPMKGETINAFIVENDSELEAFVRQIETFRI